MSEGTNHSDGERSTTTTLIGRPSIRGSATDIEIKIYSERTQGVSDTRVLIKGCANTTHVQVIPMNNSPQKTARIEMVPAPQSNPGVGAG